MNSALDYAEEVIDKNAQKLGFKRNKPVVVVFADRPNSASDGNERLRRWSRDPDADYFLVTTDQSDYLDYIVKGDQSHKIVLDSWNKVFSQKDISKFVRIINKDHRLGSKILTLKFVVQNCLTLMLSEKIPEFLIL